MNSIAHENIDDNAKAPFMRLWIAEWQSSVVTMTAAQRGAHISMLCYAWERGSCPADWTLLKRITGEIESFDLEVVLERWVRQGDCYKNRRQERERSDVRMRRDRAVRAAGRRWSNAQAMLNACSSDAQGHAQAMLNACSTPCSNDAAQSLRVSESQSIRDSDAQSVRDSESQKDSQPRRLPKQAVSAPSSDIGFDYDKVAFTGIDEATIRRWTEAYPAVDVPRTILRAAEWLAANPTQRKKKYTAFLTRWMSSDQERGGERSPSAARTITAVPKHLQF